MFATVLLVAAAAQAIEQSGLRVDVAHSPQSDLTPELHNNFDSFNSDLHKEIKIAHEDATFLYTDFTTRARREYKYFVENVTDIYKNATSIVGPNMSTGDRCLRDLNMHLQKAKHRAIKAALFNGETHHKYFKGHIIVFRMHINKSEEYVQKCDRVTSTCGLNCESNPRITRWRRQANHELQRFREDFRFSQRFFRDILTHGRKFLIHLKKAAYDIADAAKREYEECRNRGI